MVQKRKTFCLEYFKTGHGTNSAITAGYSEKTADVTASVLLRNVNVQAYLKELQDKAEAETVASVLERKQVLTEIIRGRHSDFDANPEDSDSAALSSVKRDETKFGETITITLESKTTAADLLNKMEHIYDAEGGTTNNDNRSVHFHVSNEEAKDLTEQLMEEGRTIEHKTKEQGDNGNNGSNGNK